MQKKITLYIPCYNARGTLAQCLDAVRGQTRVPDEVIVVDDCSSDGSAEVASAYPGVRVVRHDANRGLACARNTAIREAKHALVASLDADCVAGADWLELLLAELDDPVTAGAGGRLEEPGPLTLVDRWRSVHMPQHWGDRHSVKPKFLFGSNTVFRKKALEEAGLYDERLRTNYEDVDICRKILGRGHRLAYQPRARARHLKRDTLRSVFLAFWKWNKEFYVSEGFYREEAALLAKVKDTVGLANRLMDEDLAAGEKELIYLDFLLALHHSFMDFVYFSTGRESLGRDDDDYLLSWITLVDLSFSVHYNAGSRKLTSFLGKKDGVRTNVFAFLLMLHRFLSSEFGAGRLYASVMAHFLRSVGMRLDGQLLGTIDGLGWNHKDWTDLAEKEHPLIDGKFIGELNREFSSWVREKKRTFPDMEALFASTVAKLDGEVAAYGT